MKITAIIPAYNEEETIGEVVRETLQYVDEVIVIDDGSTDKTSIIAENAGAKVVRHRENKGYIEALRTGFKNATGDIIVTLDADGQHPPKYIPKLIEPILKGEADLVIGAREKLTLSERIITWLTRFKANISDASTGYRAIKSKIAKK